MEISTNADEVGAALSRFAVRKALAVRQVVRHTSFMLQTRIKANANLPAGGPPGPRNITGDYNASWVVEFEDSGFSMTGHVGTDRPQARRLEYGFMGVDILGRSYNQRPYPHVAPAVADTQPEFVAAIAAVFARG